MEDTNLAAKLSHSSKHRYLNVVYVPDMGIAFSNPPRFNMRGLPLINDVNKIEIEIETSTMHLTELQCYNHKIHAVKLQTSSRGD